MLFMIIENEFLMDATELPVPISLFIQTKSCCKQINKKLSVSKGGRKKGRYTHRKKRNVGNQ